MRKNGFTMIELIATISLLGILTVLAVTSVLKYLEQAREGTYHDFEETLESSASNFLIEHTGNIPDQNESIVIDARRLICDGYLKNLKDPRNQDLTCNDDSYVVIERKNDVSYNMDLTYHVCLSCSHYKSEACTTISTAGLPRLSASSDCS